MKFWVMPGTPASSIKICSISLYSLNCGMWLINFRLMMLHKGIAHAFPKSSCRVVFSSPKVVWPPARASLLGVASVSIFSMGMSEPAMSTGGALRTRHTCRPRQALSSTQRADGDCPVPSGRAQAKWKASGRERATSDEESCTERSWNRDSAPIIILLIAADRAEEWKRLLDEGAAFKEVGPPKWQRRKSI